MRGTIRIAGAGILTACFIVWAPGYSHAERPQAAPSAPQALRVGHDAVVIPSYRRFTAMVTGLGPPDKQGRIYSFQVKQIGREGIKEVATNQLRGWRVTILAGERFASHFEVRSNTESEITVDPQGGPLNGLAERDVLIVEDIAAGPLPVAPDGGRGQGT